MIGFQFPAQAISVKNEQVSLNAVIQQSVNMALNAVQSDGLEASALDKHLLG